MTRFASPKLIRVGCLTALAVAAAFGARDLGADDEDRAFEVWLVDQSNCPGLTYGGKVYIYEGDDLMGADASAAQPVHVIDLCQETASLALAQTGALPVRPHMLFFNSTGSHAVLAFVASGHVVFFDAATRSPVAVVRTSAGAGGARQAHAAFPAADDSYVLVANQNGKRLERIDTDYATNTYTLDAAATLDLAGCTTPNGVACQGTERPDNAPICPLIDSSSSLGFVTLRGGGLFVVNPRATPMAILGEYDRQTVHGNGCGGSEAQGSMFVDSGGGTAANLHAFDVYRFPLSGYAASNLPNTPAPETIFSDDAQDRDAHGTAVTRHQRYLWVLDRASNVAEVFDVASGAHVDTAVLTSSASDDPTPDLADISPAGNRLFVSLRGPNPLSGDPHVATGTTPGLGVVQLTEGGRTGSLKSVVRISNPDAAGTERADAHGIRVRLK
jgi:hypothetical protein